MAKQTISVEWPAVPGAAGYDLANTDPSGLTHLSNTRSTKAQFGVYQGSKVKVSVRQPTPPPSIQMPLLDAFMAELQPNNFDGGDSTDHKTAAWVAFNSPVTPRKPPNGTSPTARYLYDGDHVRYLKGFKWTTDEEVGSIDNHHDVGGDGTWGGVSAFRLDRTKPPNDSGHQLEATLEYERIKDTDAQPHSGGAHYGLPDYMLTAGVWHWLLVEFRQGRNADGILKMTDWLTGQVLVDQQGINTAGSGQNWSQGWQGVYVAWGVDKPRQVIETPDLYALASDPIAAVLNDKPVLAEGPWGTRARPGAKASSLTLGVERVQVPVSPLL